MKAHSGKMEVFDSGFVIAFKNEPITLELTSNMKITISFANDKSSKENKTEFIPKGEDDLELRLWNFNNSLGTGTTEPLKLGTIENRYLYLNFIVYSLGEDTQKSFHYTWYLGEEVNNG